MPLSDDGNPIFNWSESGATDWECDCPDFRKAEYKNPRSQFASMKQERSWQGSGAGSPGYCKHIMMARTNEGDSDGSEYKDFPSPIGEYNTYNIPRGNGSSGDNFGFQGVRGWD